MTLELSLFSRCDESLWLLRLRVLVMDELWLSWLKFRLGRRVVVEGLDTRLAELSVLELMLKAALPRLL